MRPRATQTRRAPPAAPLDDPTAGLVNGDDAAGEAIVLSAADRLALAIETSSADDKAEVRVYKLGDDERFSWCETLRPEAYERSGYAGLRSKWGAGTFKVVLYGTTNGKGGSKAGFGLRAFEQVAIAEERNAASVPAAASSEISHALEALNARIDQLAGGNVAAVDPMVQMERMFTLMKLMREATGESTRSGGGVLALLKEMRELKEFGRDLIGDGSAEPADPLTAALPGLLELIKSGMQQQPGGAQLVPPVSLPPAVAEAAAGSQPGEGEKAMPQVDDAQQLLAQMRKKLAAVIALAAADMEPELGANIIFEHLPDEFLEMLGDERWFDALCAFAPDAKPHRDWLDKARLMVIKWLEEEGGDDAAGAPAAPTPPGPKPKAGSGGAEEPIDP